MKKIIFLFVISSLFSFNSNNNDSKLSLVSLPKSNVCAEFEPPMLIEGDTLSEINKVLLAQENESDVTVEAEPKLKVHRTKTKATYYADKFHGKKTANGDVFSQTKLTAAHNTLPFGTLVKVTNLKNGKSVIVKINDRGKLGKNVTLDLSKSAIKEISPNYNKHGVIDVKVEILQDKPNVI